MKGSRFKATEGLAACELPRENLVFPEIPAGFCAAEGFVRWASRIFTHPNKHLFDVGKSLPDFSARHLWRFSVGDWLLTGSKKKRIR